MARKSILARNDKRKSLIEKFAAKRAVHQCALKTAVK
jgi:hypothetical protein